jgi:hypothetical protein
MPTYNVKLIRYISYTSEFSIDANNETHIIDKINNMNIDFLEDELKWVVVDYVRPIIDTIEDINESWSIYAETSENFCKYFNNSQT